MPYCSWPIPSIDEILDDDCWLLFGDTKRSVRVKPLTLRVPLFCCHCSPYLLVTWLFVVLMTFWLFFPMMTNAVVRPSLDGLLLLNDLLLRVPRRVPVDVNIGNDSDDAKRHAGTYISDYYSLTKNCYIDRYDDPTTVRLKAGAWLLLCQMRRKYLIQYYAIPIPFWRNVSRTCNGCRATMQWLLLTYVLPNIAIPYAMIFLPFIITNVDWCLDLLWYLPFVLLLEMAIVDW